jgi:hypothetical protein
LCTPIGICDNHDTRKKPKKSRAAHSRKRQDESEALDEPTPKNKCQRTSKHQSNSGLQSHMTGRRKNAATKTEHVDDNAPSAASTQEVEDDEVEDIDDDTREKSSWKSHPEGITDAVSYSPHFSGPLP